MTEATPEQKADIDRLVARLTTDLVYGGLCAGCLPNGEVIDEVPDTFHGEPCVGGCFNCTDTIFEIHEGYAKKVYYGE